MSGMKSKPENVSTTPSTRRGCIPASSLYAAPFKISNVIPQNRGITKERTYEKYIQNVAENRLSFIMSHNVVDLPSLTWQI